MLSDLVNAIGIVLLSIIMGILLIRTGKVFDNEAIMHIGMISGIAIMAIGLTYCISVIGSYWTEIAKLFTI